MYSIDEKDSVVAVPDLPKPTAGAGEPSLFASEYALRLAYYVYAQDDAVALVTFDVPTAHYFGPPHVDYVHSHPLHSRGLDIYGAFEVHHSSWIRSLERLANLDFGGGRHFIITFHDSMFECIAGRFSISMHKKHPAEVIHRAKMPSV
jgi:hypothetical protein